MDPSTGYHVLLNCSKLSRLKRLGPYFKKPLRYTTQRTLPTEDAIYLGRKGGTIDNGETSIGRRRRLLFESETADE